MVHDIAILFYRSDVVIQQHNSVHVIRIGFLGLPGQIPQPLRNIGG
jgi:hypothetical protein